MMLLMREEHPNPNREKWESGIERSTTGAPMISLMLRCVILYRHCQPVTIALRHSRSMLGLVMHDHNLPDLNHNGTQAQQHSMQMTRAPGRIPKSPLQHPGMSDGLITTP